MQNSSGLGSWTELRGDKNGDVVVELEAECVLLVFFFVEILNSVIVLLCLLVEAGREEE